MNSPNSPISDTELDYTLLPGYEHGDEPPCNDSDNRAFMEVAEARLVRRDFLSGSLAAAVTSVFGAVFSRPGTAFAAPEKPLLGFSPVAVGVSDGISVPPGYRARVVTRLGDPLLGDMPEWRPDGTGAEQAMQIGSHHDGIHFFPIEGSSTDGLLVTNHEYVEPRYLHGAYAGRELDANEVLYSDDGRRDDDEVLKEMNAHGVSVTRVSAKGDGGWDIVADPGNRRVTGLTEMEISGPVRGCKHVRTRFSPDGTRSRGTLNNCASGATPWNTYLAAEENWAGYFRNDDDALPREHARYGVVHGKPSRYGWETAARGADETARFDASTKGDAADADYRNEPNTFGWMVEIDPFNPEGAPVKRTHLGRFAHEGVVFAPAVPGRSVVCYSGDDGRNEYIYKFVSAAAYDPESSDGTLLDVGILYAARFNDDGTGDWLALAPGENGLTPENGFADLADILVNTRLAADLAGATKMDRPEWGAVDPNSGEVYFTLTNNTNRIQADVNGANPRADNRFGHIVRWTEKGGDHAAASFDWDLFVLAGDAHSSADLQSAPLGDDNLFACPDGLGFDADGRLWIQTDIGEKYQNRDEYEVFGNNAMLVADPRSGEIRRFLTGPVGQEITGLAMTPDQRTLFVNVQHPGATTTPEDFATGRHASHWPDGKGAVPRSATIAITREDGGVIGT